jgi:two-component system chemotaxis response regulator CheY
LKILIVDDSDTMRKVLKRTLHACGWRLTVLEARSVAQAIKVMQAERPHLILTDWVMPTISGLDFVRSLTRIGLDIPVGMVTANTTDIQVREAMLAGASFVVAKPFTTNSIKDVLTPYVIGVEVEPTKVAQDQGRDVGLNQLIASSIDQLVQPAVRRNIGQGCPVNGSAGAVFTYVSADGRVRYVLAMDWKLSNYLAAGFANSSSEQAERTITARRFRPQEQEAIYEVSNVLRGVLTSRESVLLEIGEHSYRGDGTLRSNYWQNLMSHLAGANVQEIKLELTLDGLGTGEMSLFKLPS